MERNAILKLAESYDSFYLYEEAVILRNINRLKADFPGVSFLNSAKCNPYPKVLECVLAQGFGIDAASAAECVMGQRAGLEPPAHEGDYWSDEDRARLKCLFDMGYGNSEIALELRRGEPAICQQIAHMDLFERKRRRHRVRPALPSGCLCKE